MEHKVKEIFRMSYQGTFQVVYREEVEPCEKILGGSFALALNNSGTNKLTYKARLVVKGHFDKYKDLIVNNANIIRQNFILMIIDISAVFGFQVWSQDVSKAYLHAGEKLMRSAYLRGPGEFLLEAGHGLKVLKPLRGFRIFNLWQSKGCTGSQTSETIGATLSPTIC